MQAFVTPFYPSAKTVNVNSGKINYTQHGSREYSTQRNTLISRYIVKLHVLFLVFVKKNITSMGVSYFPLEIYDKQLHI